MIARRFWEAILRQSRSRLIPSRSYGSWRVPPGQCPKGAESGHQLSFPLFFRGGKRVHLILGSSPSLPLPPFLRLHPPPLRAASDPRLSSGPPHVPDINRGSEGASRGRALLSHRPIPSAQSSRPAPQIKRVPRPPRQTRDGSPAHPELSSRAGATTLPQATGARPQSTGPTQSRSPAASPTRSSCTRRGLRSILSAVESAKPRPQFCLSGRSGRSEGAGQEIFNSLPRQVSQASKGHKDIWHGVFCSVRPR
ncbi:hypothetical protein NDU88_006084 [Pleurodeles waltl]|uniref:Uncharacterized protein n=1 Tax=Pleurodeles waltl TaxID=8319 RepID=A0AAV7N098_PLEWA|nr:hypothetical protein NDU88_006084 [Pleurodeles waltl]